LLLAGLIGPSVASLLVRSNEAKALGRQIIYVGQANSGIDTITDALAIADPGAIIRVAAGKYKERLLINKPVTIESFPAGSDVEIVWQTDEPYEHTVWIGKGASRSGPGVPEAPMGDEDSANETILRGLRIRHQGSPTSNDYAVYITAGSPLVAGCDISSGTGTGIGVEAAKRPRIMNCRVRGCAGHGIAVFGAMDEYFCGGGWEEGNPVELAYLNNGVLVANCEVESNGLDGVVVRGGAKGELLSNVIRGNQEFGVSVQLCSGYMKDNQVFDNARGAVSLLPSFDSAPVKTEVLKASNQLKGDIQSLDI